MEIAKAEKQEQHYARTLPNIPLPAPAVGDASRISDMPPFPCSISTDKAVATSFDLKHGGEGTTNDLGLLFSSILSLFSVKRFFRLLHLQQTTVDLQ